VVLANPDLQSLYSTAEVGRTVVVISQHVQFVDKGEWTKQRDAASAMLEDWGQSLENADADKVLSYYSPNSARPRAKT
jgi:triosephosphate isomerase